MTQNRQQQAAALEGAFHAFNDVYEQLAHAYGELEQRVADLSTELAAARHERFLHLAEQARLASRLQHLLTVLPGAVIVIDGNDVVREGNAHAHKLFGKDLVGQRWATIAQQVFAENTAPGHDIPLSDGRWLSFASCELDVEPGRILLFQDITETHRLQADIDRHRRLSAMGEMLAALAHQIRTPLATSLLYLSNLTRAKLPSPDHQRFVNKTQGALKHLEQMVNDMLVFAKGGEAAADTIVMTSFVDELRQLIETQFVENKAQFILHQPIPAVTFPGSKAALLSVFQNLITNALQAGAREIQFSIQLWSRDVKFVLSDNGPGMKDVVLERVFEPFFSTRSGGTGLGLAVARSVVLAHQGSIDVTSTPGVGTSFVIGLPSQGEDGFLPSSNEGHLATLRDKGVARISSATMPTQPRADQFATGSVVIGDSQ